MGHVILRGCQFDNVNELFDETIADDVTVFCLHAVIDENVSCTIEHNYSITALLNFRPTSSNNVIW